MKINIRKERNKRNWTQQDLSAAANLSLITVARLEHERENFDRFKFGTLKKIAAALDIDIKDLIDEDK